MLDLGIDINSNAQENIKKYIRIFFFDADTKKGISVARKDEYCTTVDLGYEDLDLRADAAKIYLYQTSKFIQLYDGLYEVKKTEFMPCTPVCLYLYLKKSS